MVIFEAQKCYSWLSWCYVKVFILVYILSFSIFIYPNILETLFWRRPVQKCFSHNLNILNLTMILFWHESDCNQFGFSFCYHYCTLTLSTLGETVVYIPSVRYPKRQWSEFPLGGTLGHWRHSSLLRCEKQLK